MEIGLPLNPYRNFLHKLLVSGGQPTLIAGQPFAYVVISLITSHPGLSFLFDISLDP